MYMYVLYYMYMYMYVHVMYVCVHIERTVHTRTCTAHVHSVCSRGTCVGVQQGQGVVALVIHSQQCADTSTHERK